MKSVIVADRAKAELGQNISDTDVVINLAALSQGMTGALSSVDDQSDPVKIAVLTISQTPDSEDYELVEVTAWDSSTNEATVNRGAFGSSAFSWASGLPVTLTFSANHFDGNYVPAPSGGVRERVAIAAGDVPTSMQPRTPGSFGISIGNYIYSKKGDYNISIGSWSNLGGRYDDDDTATGPRANFQIGRFTSVKAVKNDAGLVPKRVAANTIIGSFSYITNESHALILGNYTEVENTNTQQNDLDQPKHDIVIGYFSFLTRNYVDSYSAGNMYSAPETEVLHNTAKYSRSRKFLSSCVIGAYNDLYGSRRSILIGSTSTAKKRSNYSTIIGQGNNATAASFTNIFGRTNDIYQDNGSTVLGNSIVSISAKYNQYNNMPDDTILYKKNVFIGNDVSLEGYLAGDASGTPMEYNVVIGDSASFNGNETVSIGRFNTTGESSRAQQAVSIGYYLTNQGNEGVTLIGRNLEAFSKNSFAHGLASSAREFRDEEAVVTLVHANATSSLTDDVFMGKTQYFRALTDAAGRVQMTPSFDVRSNGYGRSIHRITGEVVVVNDGDNPTKVVRYSVSAIVAAQNGTADPVIVNKTITQEFATTVASEGTDVSLDLVIADAANGLIALEAELVDANDIYQWFGQLESTIYSQDV